MQLHHSMANIEIYKYHSYSFDFCQGMAYANDFNTHTHRQTERQRNGQAHRYRRNLADLPHNHNSIILVDCPLKITTFKKEQACQLCESAGLSAVGKSRSICCKKEQVRLL